MSQTFDLQRDHVWLIERCAELLAEKGVLLFACNYRRKHEPREPPTNPDEDEARTSAIPPPAVLHTEYL